jgi:hypothetical protein
VGVIVGAGMAVGGGDTTSQAQMTSAVVMANMALLDFDWLIAPPPFASARQRW